MSRTSAYGVVDEGDGKVPCDVFDPYWSVRKAAVKAVDHQPNSAPWSILHASHLLIRIRRPGVI